MPARKVLICAGVVCSMLVAGATAALDQTSPGFRHRSGRFGALGAGVLESSAAMPRFASSTATLGGVAEQAIFVGSGSLRALLPGLAWVLAGASPSLDLDGDGLPNPFDPDDDGDGLFDVDETNTGAFVGPTNTGTSPFLTDSDVDGFDDGVEIDAGSDPTDATSRPVSNAVPFLDGALRFFLLLALLATGTHRARLRRGRST